MTHAPPLAKIEPPLAKRQVWISWNTWKGLKSLSQETDIPMQKLLDRFATEAIAQYKGNPNALKQAIADAA